MYLLFTVALFLGGIGLIMWRSAKSDQASKWLVVIRQCKQCGWCLLNDSTSKHEIFAPDKKCDGSHCFEFIHLPQRESYFSKWAKHPKQ